MFENGNDLLHNERHLINIYLKNTLFLEYGGAQRKDSIQTRRTWFLCQFLHVSLWMSYHIYPVSTLSSCEDQKERMCVKVV